MWRNVVDANEIFLIVMEILFEILQDMLFAAMAAIGFASISNTPFSAMKYCALLGAVGHSMRFVMMTYLGVHIISAAAIAALAIGILAIPFAPKAKCPPETFSYPALLPMIPGMYAYRAVQGLVMCLSSSEESVFDHYFYLMNFNGLTCIIVVAGMVLGVTLPIFVFKHISFSATREIIND